MKRVLSFVQQFFIPAPLCAAVTQALAALCQPVTIDAGDIIFDQGDRVKAFYWIQSGLVELRCATGRVLKVLPENRMMGEDHVFDNATTHDYAAIALNETILIKVDASGFMALVEQYPDLGLKLLKAVALSHLNQVDMVEDDMMPDLSPLSFITHNFMSDTGYNSKTMSNSSKSQGISSFFDSLDF